MNNNIKKAAKLIATKVISSGPYEWPPSCILFAYQPMRPEQKTAQCDNTDAPENKEDN